MVKKALLFAFSKPVPIFLSPMPLHPAKMSTIYFAPFRLEFQLCNISESIIAWADWYLVLPGSDKAGMELLTENLRTVEAMYGWQKELIIQEEPFSKKVL